MYLFYKFSIVKVVSLTLLSTASHYALAKPPMQEKYDVLKQASSYARASACMTTFDDDAEGDVTTVKDVHLVKTQAGTNKGSEIGMEYIVYWGGDMGCAGGSGTYSHYLTSFSRDSESRPFLINKEDIVDDINDTEYQINTRFIEDVTFNNGTLLITSSDYSGDDTDGGNNFPRYTYRYTAVYDSNSNKWRLTNKALIKDNYPKAVNSNQL